MTDETPIPCGACGAASPVCDGSGWQRTEGGARPCPNFKAQLGARRLEASGIPKRFRESTFDNFRTADLRGKAILEAHVALLRRYAARLATDPAGLPSLLLTGDPGTGKTHLAAAVAREAALAGLDVRFAEVTALITRLTDTIDGEGTAAEILSPLLTCDLLVLDEIGARRPTPYVANILYLLFNGRYNDTAPIVSTTNLIFPEKEGVPRDRLLSSIVGERIASRLYEARVLSFEEVEDYRKSNRKLRRPDA